MIIGGSSGAKCFADNIFYKQIAPLEQDLEFVIAYLVKR
jgi:hypothetical protein